MADLLARFRETPSDTATSPSADPLARFRETPSAPKGTLGAYGATLKEAVKGIPGYVAGAIEGATPYDDTNFLDTLQQKTQEGQDRFINQPDAGESALGGLAKKGDIYQSVKSLSGSMASMGPTLAGAALGSMAGPVGTVVGGLAGAGLGLIGMKRNAENQFVKQNIEQANAKLQEQGQPALTQEQAIAEQNRINATGDTAKIGYSEALPETLGNLAEIGVMASPVGNIAKGIGTLASPLARAAAVGLAKAGATQLTELGEEEVTRQLQNPIMQRHGFPEQTAGETAKQTAIATLPFALVGGGAGAYQGYTSAKKDITDTAAREDFAARARRFHEASQRNAANRGPLSQAAAKAQPAQETVSDVINEAPEADASTVINEATKRTQEAANAGPTQNDINPDQRRPDAGGVQGDGSPVAAGGSNGAADYPAATEPSPELKRQTVKQRIADALSQTDADNNPVLQGRARAVMEQDAKLLDSDKLDGDTTGKLEKRIEKIKDRADKFGVVLADEPKGEKNDRPQANGNEPVLAETTDTNGSVLNFAENNGGDGASFAGSNTRVAGASSAADTDLFTTAGISGNNVRAAADTLDNKLDSVEAGDIPEIKPEALPAERTPLANNLNNLHTTGITNERINQEEITSAANADGKNTIPGQQKETLLTPESKDAFTFKTAKGKEVNKLEAKPALPIESLEAVQDKAAAIPEKIKQDNAIGNEGVSQEAPVNGSLSDAENADGETEKQPGLGATIATGRAIGEDVNATPTPTTPNPAAQQPAPYSDKIESGITPPSAPAQAEPVAAVVPTVAKTGKPFSTEKVAQAALKSSAYPETADTHKVVPVKGGFGLAPITNNQEISNELVNQEEAQTSAPAIDNVSAEGVTKPPKAEDYKTSSDYHAAKLAYRAANNIKQTDNSKALHELNGEIKKAQAYLDKKRAGGEKSFTAASAKINAQFITKAEDKLNELVAKRDAIINPQEPQKPHVQEARAPEKTPQGEAAAAKAGSLKDFTDKKLNDSGYRKSYEKSPELLAQFKASAKEEWKKTVESATERLPDHVIDEYVDNYGMAALQSRLRGIHEAAIKGWMPKDIREQELPKQKPLTASQRPVHERTWPQQLEEIKKSVSRKLSRKEISDEKNTWLSAISKAEYEKKTIPENVLKSRTLFSDKKEVTSTPQDALKQKVAAQREKSSLKPFAAQVDSETKSLKLKTPDAISRVNNEVKQRYEAQIKQDVSEGKAFTKTQLNDIADNELEHLLDRDSLTELGYTKDMQDQLYAAKKEGKDNVKFSQAPPTTGSTRETLLSWANANDRKLIQQGRVIVAQSLKDIPKGVLDSGDMLQDGKLNNLSSSKKVSSSFEIPSNFNGFDTTNSFGYLNAVHSLLKQDDKFVDQLASFLSKTQPFMVDESKNGASGNARLFGDVRTIESLIKQINNLIDNIIRDGLTRSGSSVNFSSDIGVAKSPLNKGINSASFSSDYSTNIPTIESLISKGQDKISIKSARHMMRSMGAAVHDLKIRDAIVKLVAIDMVNNFSREKLSSNMLFHDIPVFKDKDSIDMDKSISSIIDMPFRDFIGKFTRNGAEETFRSIQFIRPAFDLFSASGTIDNRHDVTPESNVMLGDKGADTSLSPSIISQNARIEAFYKDGKIYLIADAIGSKAQFDQVKAHEYLHAAIATNPKLKERLLGAHSELRDIFKQVESGQYTGRYKAIYDKAMQRVDKAKTTPEARFEEWLAYQVTAWNQSPQSIPERLAKAIKDLVAVIKAAIFKYTGHIANISPADLSALARSAMTQPLGGNAQYGSNAVVMASKQGYQGNDTGEAEEWLRAKAKGLDMSKRARMERAKAMGFDTSKVWYHGTSSKFDSFDRDYLGYSSAKGSGTEDGFFFAEDKDHADYWGSNASYTNGGRKRILKVFLKTANPLKVDVDNLIDEGSNLPIEESIEKAKDNDNDSIIFENMRDDESMEPRTTAFIFETNQIRSINAAFDPDYADSPNLLASVKESKEQPDIRYSVAEDVRNSINDIRNASATELKDKTKHFFNKTIHALDSIGPLKDLPEKEDYLVKRYLTLGKIAKVDEVAREIYDSFKNAGEDQVKVFEYLTNKDADPNKIQNSVIRESAKKTKKTIMGVGQQLVDRGLLSKEVYETNKGKYLPQVYLMHLLDDNSIAAFGSGKKPSDLGYLKKRKDIPEDVRRLIMGQITDPGYLASKGYGQQMRDVALLDWIEQISQNKDWILQQSLTDWKGQKVTPFWLKSEAQRIRAQAIHYTPANKTEALELANQMDETANTALEDSQAQIAPDGFKKIPDAPRYGKMRGLIVRAEIYDDIVGSTRINTGDESVAEQILGYGGLATKFTQLWKWSKVAANPPAQIRNFLSNGILLHLSGVPFHKVPSRVMQAIKEIRTDGTHWQIAKKYGVTESTFGSQELFRIERELLDLDTRNADKISFATLKNMAGKVMDKTGDIYQFSEAIFKTAKIIDEMEKGTSESKAALEAQKWMFDYSLVTPSMRYLRNAPIGVPFLTFYMKALPRMLEVAATRPLAFAPYVALPMALTALVAGMADVDDDDVDKLKLALPEWLQKRGHAYFIPAKDENGRWQAIDFGYFMPWTMWTELANSSASGEFGDALKSTGILGGPVPSMISAIQTNKDPFTQKEIVNKNDPGAKQISSIMAYLYNLSMPTWVTNNGFAGKMYDALNEVVDKQGDVKTTGIQAGLRLVGVNMYSVDPVQSRANNIKHMKYEISDIKARRTQLLKDRNLSTEERKSIFKEYNEMIKAKQVEMRDYSRVSVVHPNLR